MHIKLLSHRTKAIIALALGFVVIGSTGTVAIAKETYENVYNSESDMSQYRNIMYYGDYSIWAGEDKYYPQYIAANNLTHLVFGDLDIDKEGNLVFTDLDSALANPLNIEGVIYGDASSGCINALRVLKQKYPNLKIGFSIGGIKKSADFVTVSSDKVLRKKLAKQIADFLEYSDMDFVNVDWETPTVYREAEYFESAINEGCPGTPEDKENFVYLLQDIRDEIDKKGNERGKSYELSAQLPAEIDVIKQSIDIEKVFNIIDFANLLTYNMRDSYEDISGHHSPLYTNPNDPLKNKGLSIDECVKFYLSQGAESNKLVVGNAFFTRGYEEVLNNGTDSENPGVFASTVASGVQSDGSKTVWAKSENKLRKSEGKWAYRNLSKLKEAYKGLNEYWDDYSKVPYLYNQETGAFFTYDNVKSIQEKCNYVKENNLGGMMSFTASYDNFTDETSLTRDELTKVIKESLYGDNKLSELPVVIDSSDIQISMSVEPNAFKGSDLNIKIKNNEMVSSSSTALKKLESNYKTLINCKVYIKANNLDLTYNGISALNLVNENGYYIIDLAEHYDTKEIAPQEEMNLKFHTNEILNDCSKIEAIYVTQRIYKDSAEYRKNFAHINQNPDIDITEISKIALKYNIKKDEDGYDIECDKNKDGIIDLYDLVEVARLL